MFTRLTEIGVSGIQVPTVPEEMRLRTNYGQFDATKKKYRRIQLSQKDKSHGSGLLMQEQLGCHRFARRVVRIGKGRRGVKVTARGWHWLSLVSRDITCHPIRTGSPSFSLHRLCGSVLLCRLGVYT